MDNAQIVLLAVAAPMVLFMLVLGYQSIADALTRPD